MKNAMLLIPVLLTLSAVSKAELSFGPRKKVSVVSSSSTNEVALGVFVSPNDKTEVMIFSRSPNGGGVHDLWQSSRVIPNGEW